jgi:hypothetical protein
MPAPKRSFEVLQKAFSARRHPIECRRAAG